jgi:hypothetical protein
VVLIFQNYQFVAFTFHFQKSKTINLWLFDYQFVAFDYQFVAFRKLWITHVSLIFTGFEVCTFIQKNASKYLK